MLKITWMEWGSCVTVAQPIPSHMFKAIQENNKKAPVFITVTT